MSSKSSSVTALPESITAMKPEAQKIVYSFVASIAVVSLVLALFDIWVGTKAKKAPSWAFVILLILGALGVAASIFRVVAAPKHFFAYLIPALVAFLYFYIGTSGSSSPKWAFTTLTVIGFVKGISAIAALVFALSASASVKY
jgi:F0F1-type ATP synthase assembly protein I